MRTPVWLFLIPFSLAFGQNPKPIFDGGRVLRPSALAAADAEVFRTRVVPAARKAWAAENRCEAGSKPAVIDVASGAFTRAGARQNAILYKYWSYRHGMAFGAIPDLNGNGIAEIVVASGATNQGITWMGMTLVEVSAWRGQIFAARRS